MSTRSPRLVVRTLIGSALALGGLLPLAGCSNRYPDTLHYPVRGDLLVLKTPTTPPTHLDPPGDLNQWLAKLPAEGATVADPATMDGNERSQLATALDKLFGTPAHPTVKAEGSEDEIQTLKLDDKTLATGSNLYREHCLHCHGVSGDGKGPTAPWINPHPRDYRRGIFKFTSSSQPTGIRKPRRDDLVRTLTQGVEGTAMPAFGAQSNSKFGVLQEPDIEALVSYVIHLSLRGQVEFETMQPRLGKPENRTELEVDDQPASIAEYAAYRLKTVIGYWAQAGTKVIQPGKYPIADNDPARARKLQESIARGFKLFVEPGPASCIKCHMDFGRRNNFLYDDWGTVVRPIDLTQGVYRGGRRPLDLYWRMHAGVNGAGMPAFSDSLDADKLWDVVNFVQALPYPAMLPDDIRRQIYEGGTATALAPAHPGTKPEAQE